jgi:hypothetical protein
MLVQAAADEDRCGFSLPAGPVPALALTDKELESNRAARLQNDMRKFAASWAPFLECGLTNFASLGIGHLLSGTRKASQRSVSRRAFRSSLFPGEARREAGGLDAWRLSKETGAPSFSAGFPQHPNE